MKKSHEVTLWNPETHDFVSFLTNIWGQPYIQKGHVFGCTYEVEKDVEYVSKDDGNRRYIDLRRSGFEIWKPTGIYYGYPHVLF